VPSALRKAAGNTPGSRVAIMLYDQATPVPMAIRVNMLRLRLTSDAQPRSKNGQPAQSTTGVASSICTQFETAGLNSIRLCEMCPLISIRNRGNARARPIQNRRVMSTSSGLGPLSAVTSSGSRAMPQIGQVPGPNCRISRSIGQM
jgi:hypothetical protein